MTNPVGPIAAYTRLGTHAEASSTVRVWKTKDTAIVLALAMDQRTMVSRVPSSSPWERGLSTRIYNRILFQDGSVISHPGVRRNCPISGGTLLFKCSREHWKHTLSGPGRTSSKEERRQQF